MAQRAAVVLLTVVSFTIFSASQGLQSGQVVSGVVVSAEQRPVGDARVEIQNIRSGSPVATAHTDAAGAFQLHNVPPGEYEITATMGLIQASERLTVSSFGITGEVVLHLPFQTAGQSRTVGDEHSVSVRQLQVPRRATSELSKAQRALNNGDLDRAHRHVERALERYPHFPEALTLRAVLKASEDDLAGAVQDLEQALFIDANYSMAYIVLAATFNRYGRYSEAVRSADRAVALAPRAWQACFELGKAMLGVGDFQAALQQLDRAQGLIDNEYPPLHLVRAHALLGLEHYEAATASLQRYLAKNPEGPDAADARRTLDQVQAFRASAR